MGLDIMVVADNSEQLYDNEENDYFDLHSLSRTFCNFMCRKDVVEHPAELDQIGEITGVDINILYEMNNYPYEEYIEYELEYAETDEERRQILAKAEEDKKLLEGNIEKVLATVNNLIDKISHINNLPQHLLPTDFDSLHNSQYFADFDKDKGEGYIGNNFGQDLRNFKRFLEYSKERGGRTVWFTYN